MLSIFHLSGMLYIRARQLCLSFGSATLYFIHCIDTGLAIQKQNRSGTGKGRYVESEGQ